MSTTELTALRAKHGDALVLSHGGVRVLIDGGASGVYRQTLRPFLEALDTGDGRVPVLDLTMVSHIDSDHIAGVLDLVDELVDADAESSRPLVELREVWHNSFADMLAGAEAGTRGSAKEESLALADLSATDTVLAGLMRDSNDVLASVGQGRRLRDDLARLAVDVNEGFPDRLVLRNSRVRTWERKGLALEVIGPGRKELDALRAKWKKLLPKILERERSKEARAAAAASLDRSVFNLSSLVVVASAGTRRLLLTGDARGDAILEWLPATRAGGSEHFDVIKLPHHGSDRNVTPDFFERITADRYLVSGDGRHGNPEPEMFEMLFTARPAIDYRIHMTYGVDELAKKTEFDVAGLRRVLDKDPRRRGCLRFPGVGEPATTISL